MPVTFAVSDVARADAPLESVSGPALLANRGLTQVEGASAPAQPYVACEPLHGLLVAVHLAYAEHRPLVLSPDDVWVCIAQGLARHVEANAERLRPRLVRHAGKLALEVRRDDLVPGAPDNDWPGAVGALSHAVRAHVGGRRDLFVASFSTTTPAARTASEVALLSGMQQYFTYTVSTLCGIPEVTLLGTPEDFRGLAARVEVLADFDLAEWVEVLRPVVRELEATANGRPNRRFWSELYKLVGASGGPEISGWVNALFPYLGDRGVDRPNPALRGSAPELMGPKLGSFPSGLAVAPFTWKVREVERPMSLVGGFFGVTQDAAGALRPSLGWAVAPAVAAREFHLLPRGDGVTFLTPREMKALRSLASLAREAPPEGKVHVSVSWCDALEALDLPHDAHVTELTALSCAKLESLAPLAGHPTLEELTVQQCPAFVDLRAVASLPALRRITLAHDPALADLSPLRDAPWLERIRLFGDAIPEPLRGVHEGPDAVARLFARLAAAHR